MTTLSQYQTQRSSAGSRYSAAVTEFLASLVDLAALDATVSNRNVGGTIIATFGAGAVGSWADLLRIVEHAEFSPLQHRRLADEVRAASDAYIANLT